MLTQTKTKNAVRNTSQQQTAPEPKKSVSQRMRNRAFEPRRPRMALILVSVLMGMALGFIWASDSHAMPAHPKLLQAISNNQIPESFYLQNLDKLQSIGIDTPDPKLKTKYRGEFGMVALAGNQNILTIMVNFSDKPSQTNAVSFDTLIYLNRTGTVNNYYREVSYNALIIATVNLPSSLDWRQAPNTYPYYVNNQNGIGSYPHNTQKLVEDLVDLVDSLVDFSQYDNDKDGTVDGLIVVHSGPGAEYTGQNSDIWSHQWGIIPRLKDGVYISTYSIEPEYWDAPGDMTCGVYCHELGHVFGLPDFYDIDYTSEGVGSWSLMAAGSWNGTLGNSPAHLDPYCRIQLGFVTPNVPALNLSTASLLAVESDRTIYKLWTNGSPLDEYYLLENRQQTGYDTYLPGSGLLLWHVDESTSDNTDEWWPDCGRTAHYKIALVQADDQWQLEHGINQGDDGDPFPGATDNRSFGSSSAPNSNSYSGAATNVVLANISNSGYEMTADISVSSSQAIEERAAIIPGQAALLPNYPNPFNSQTDIRFELKKDALAEISIFDIRGAKVKQLFAGRLQAGIHQAVWEGLDESGKKASSGVYFYQLSLNGERICKKMSLLK
jgi:immune inhibitor A